MQYRLKMQYNNSSYKYMFILNCLELRNVSTIIRKLIKINILFIYNSKVQFLAATKQIVLNGSYLMLYTNTLDIFSVIDFNNVSFIC